MKKGTLALGAGLILLTGWLLVPEIASAQATKEPIEGQWDLVGKIGQPESRWVDAGGNIHVRGQNGELLWLGDVQGLEHWLANWNNTTSGAFAEWGTASFSGWLFGEAVAWEATYSLDCITRANTRTCSASYIGHLEDGRLLNVSGSWVEGAPILPYTGFVIDPPGRD